MEEIFKLIKEKKKNLLKDFVLKLRQNHNSHIGNDIINSLPIFNNFSLEAF
jgi:hypothetical protein